MMMTHCQDHILTENVCSTSLSGDVTKQDHDEHGKIGLLTTQPIDTGWLQYSWLIKEGFKSRFKVEFISHISYKEQCGGFYCGFCLM